MSNLDYLIEELQLEMGDIDGTAYSTETYRRALVSAVKMLSKRWNGKYYIDDDSNIQRNSDITFDTTSPPIIEANDEYAIILAGAVILRKVALTSSADSFSNWSTPDLSVSTGSQERALTKLYSDAVQALEDYFRGRLGRSRKRFMLKEDLTYPTFPAVVDRNNC